MAAVLLVLRRCGFPTAAKNPTTTTIADGFCKLNNLAAFGDAVLLQGCTRTAFHAFFLPQAILCDHLQKRFLLFNQAASSDVC